MSVSGELVDAQKQEIEAFCTFRGLVMSYLSVGLMRDMNVNIPTAFEGAWSEIHDELDELPTKRQVQKEGGLYRRERANMLVRSTLVLEKMKEYLPPFKTVFAGQQQEVERRYDEAVTAGETWRGMADGGGWL
jgi:hypothetical protein